MKSHTDLIVWQKSIDLVETVYQVTGKFPTEEKFGLISQIRRCAVSIPSNIAEGHGRKSDGEFCQFLRIAYGSSSELETQIILSKRLSFIRDSEHENIMSKLTEIHKMLNTLISKSLKAKS